MKLFVDDSRPKPVNYDLACDNAETAIRFLEVGNIDEISLDHDLGDGNGSGYDIACWIENAAIEGRLNRLKWNIHSANPVGRSRIMAALNQAEKAWSKRELEESK